MCVKGVGDVASSCRGDRGDACLKACGLGPLPPHTVTLCLPYFSNIPHFLPILSSFLSPPLYPTHTHTRTLATEEGRRTPNAISTPLSTFVLMNRGGLVGHQTTLPFPRCRLPAYTSRQRLTSRMDLASFHFSCASSASASEVNSSTHI